MNNEVIAHIDISTPAGRKIVRELEKHKKNVKIEYPLPPEISGKTYSEDEVWEMVENRMSEHYGVKINIR
ncbi:hypothetical protein D0T49_00560 [Paludibacter sp. 221]|uniref:hypothetical protein n=1 Tax=Paludibacter sp. 221 TaxID=2302939 RepID=UPI0013D5012C|nr:hypothetical protein [Paludibacter sp. 221]NDV45544.1 hypothetical protein [Paludibacter sp. 221]